MATVTQPQAESRAEPAGPDPLIQPTAMGYGSLVTLRLSPEIDQAIERLMRRMSMSKAEVFNVSIGLFQTMVTAVDEGKRVGIADDDAELEVEFTGF